MMIIVISLNNRHHPIFLIWVLNSFASYGQIHQISPRFCLFSRNQGSGLIEVAPTEPEIMQIKAIIEKIRCIFVPSFICYQMTKKDYK